MVVTAVMGLQFMCLIQPWSIALVRISHFFKTPRQSLCSQPHFVLYQQRSYTVIDPQPHFKFHWSSTTGVGCASYPAWIHKVSSRLQNVGHRIDEGI